MIRFAGQWIELKNIKLNEVIQAQKDEHHKKNPSF